MCASKISFLGEMQICQRLPIGPMIPGGPVGPGFPAGPCELPQYLVIFFYIQSCLRIWTEGLFTWMPFGPIGPSFPKMDLMEQFYCLSSSNELHHVARVHSTNDNIYLFLRLVQHCPPLLWGNYNQIQSILHWPYAIIHGILMFDGGYKYLKPRGPTSPGGPGNPGIPRSPTDKERYMAPNVYYVRTKADCTYMTLWSLWALCSCRSLTSSCSLLTIETYAHEFIRICSYTLICLLDRCVNNCIYPLDLVRLGSPAFL